MLNLDIISNKLKKLFTKPTKDDTEYFRKKGERLKKDMRKIRERIDDSVKKHNIKE